MMCRVVVMQCSEEELTSTLYSCSTPTTSYAVWSTLLLACTVYCMQCVEVCCMQQHAYTLCVLPHTASTTTVSTTLCIQVHEEYVLLTCSVPIHVLCISMYYYQQCTVHAGGYTTTVCTMHCMHCSMQCTAYSLCIMVHEEYMQKMLDTTNHTSTSRCTPAKRCIHTPTQSEGVYILLRYQYVEVYCRGYTTSTYSHTSSRGSGCMHAMDTYHQQYGYIQCVHTTNTS